MTWPTACRAAITLPPTFGTGAKDNMLASGQFIIVPGSGAVNKGSAVVFVGFATGTAAIKHASGTISYAAGTGCDVATQSYTIDTVRDWGSKDKGALVTFPHRNKSDATQSAAATSLFTFSVPLTCPGATVTTISLPLVTNSVLAGAASLHFMGLGIRPSITGVAWRCRDTPDVTVTTSSADRLQRRDDKTVVGEMIGRMLLGVVEPRRPLFAAIGRNEGKRLAYAL